MDESVDFINVSINHGIYHHRSHNQGMYVSAEWSSQPMYRHNILTLYLFDLCSRFVKVRKWRVLGGLSLNYRWGRSARCGYKYTATVVGRVAEQWGRQLSGWWGSRAGLSTGCVFCTIIWPTGWDGWAIASNVHHDDPMPSMYMPQSPFNASSSIQKQLYLLTWQQVIETENVLLFVA